MTRCAYSNSIGARCRTEVAAGDLCARHRKAAPPALWSATVDGDVVTVQTPAGPHELHGFGEDEAVDIAREMYERDAAFAADLAEPADALDVALAVARGADLPAIVAPCRDAAYVVPEQADFERVDAEPEWTMAEAMAALDVVRFAHHDQAPVVHRDLKPDNAHLSLPGIDVAPRGARLPAELVRQRELGQFFTPPWLANEVARIADVRGCNVLEPSAGNGNIVAACLDAGASAVLAIEKDPHMVAKLRERFAGHSQVSIIEGDFLAVDIDPTAIDLIVGNPPYDHGADGDHLARMVDLMQAGADAKYVRGYRMRGPEAVLLLRTVVLHSGDRFERVWSRAHVHALHPVADRVAFEIDGKIADAGKIDVSIFVLSTEAPDEPCCTHVREPKRAVAA